MEYEVTLQQLGEVVEIQHQNLDFALDLPEKSPLSIPKTDEVMEMLHRFAFSASSLQTFIACPLKFYFQYLMRIRETPVLSDHLDAYELGTVIHAVYKKAFDDIIKETDTTKYSDILKRHIDTSDADICEKICRLEGRKSLTDRDLEQGYWLINRKVIGAELGLTTEPDDSQVEAYLNDKMHEANHKLPQYKIVRNYVFSEEDMIKTTTLKIKRPKEQEHIESRLAELGHTMYDMNGKNFDKMIKANP